MNRNIHLQCLLLLAGTGCSSSLVFANPGAGVRPEPVSAASTCVASQRRPSIDRILDAGDEYRDALLSPRSDLPRFDPVGPLPSDSVGLMVAKQREKVRAAVQDAMAQWKQAQVCYDAALQLDPSQSYALLNLAVINLRMYDLDPDASDREQFYTRAQGYLGRASEVNRYDAQTIYYQAELKVRRQRWSEAEALLKSLLSQGWNRAHVHNLLGFVYQMTDRAGRARDEWAAATQIDQPAEANAWAIQRTKPPAPLPPEQRAAPAESFERWDPGQRMIVPAKPPPLPQPCVWLENGRSQC